jgi:hypothetical protein
MRNVYWYSLVGIGGWIFKKKKKSINVFEKESSLPVLEAEPWCCSKPFHCNTEYCFSAVASYFSDFQFFLSLQLRTGVFLVTLPCNLAERNFRGTVSVYRYLRPSIHSQYQQLCMQFLENYVLGISNHHSDGHQNFIFVTNFQGSSYLYARIHRECLSKSVKAKTQP